MEVGSKSSKVWATMVGRRRKFWVAERLKHVEDGIKLCIGIAMQINLQRDNVIN